MIQAQEISKLYGKQKAVDNVSFEINKGDIVGFLGPNGAGKSTLMKILTGFIPASSGTAQIEGLDIRKDSLAIRKITGYLPEHNPLYLDMYVKEYLSFVASIYKMKKLSVTVTDMIERTGLSRESHKKIGALSKGYRQRVGLAQALIHNPSVLILDEPTSGLDPNQIVEIRNLISDIGKEKTVLLSTHIMQEVEAICKKVIIINLGKIVAFDDAKNLTQQAETKFITILVEFDKKVPIEDLQKISGVSNAVKTNETTWLIQSNSEVDIRPAVFTYAVNNNLTVLSMQKKERKLEDVFHELTTLKKN